jgi:hypothetical protein
MPNAAHLPRTSLDAASWQSPHALDTAVRRANLCLMLACPGTANPDVAIDRKWESPLVASTKFL